MGSSDTAKFMLLQGVQSCNACFCILVIIAAFLLGFGVTTPSWMKSVFISIAVFGSWALAGAFVIFVSCVVTVLLFVWVRPAGLSNEKNIHAQVGESRTQVGNTIYVTRYYGWISRRDQYYRFRGGMIFLVVFTSIVYLGVVAIFVAQQYMYWTGNRLPLPWD